MSSSSEGSAAPAPGRTPAREGLPREAVEWGFRLLAGRAPVNAAEFASFQALPDIEAMRRAFTNTAEFHGFFDSVLTGFPAYNLPLFLLRPPADPNLEWHFVPPDLETPGCQICTASQFDEPVFQEIAAAMGVRPSRTRALWEQVWAVSVLATAGLIAPGRRGLGLETDRERIAAVLAARGVAVHATGTAEPVAAALETRRLQLFYPEAVHIASFDEQVAFAALDPRLVGGLTEPAFDFCWSFGMPGRLGSIAATLDFFEASLAPLRPGGLAVHGAALNLSSDRITWERPDLVILRRSDIEELHERLARRGHKLLPLNTHPGTGAADEEVTVQPGTMAAHRQRLGVIVTAGFGLAIRKAG